MLGTLIPHLLGTQHSTQEDVGAARAFMVPEHLAFSTKISSLSSSHPSTHTSAANGGTAAEGGLSSNPASYQVLTSIATKLINNH